MAPILASIMALIKLAINSKKTSASIMYVKAKKKRQFSKLESCRFFLYSYLLSILSSLFTKNCRFQIIDKRE